MFLILPRRGQKAALSFYRPGLPRVVVSSIGQFGGIGDGATSNIGACRMSHVACRMAVEHLKEFAGQGGAKMNVQAGSRGSWARSAQDGRRS